MSEGKEGQEGEEGEEGLEHTTHPRRREGMEIGMEIGMGIGMLNVPPLRNSSFKFIRLSNQLMNISVPSVGELMAVKQIAIDEVSTKELSSLENEINLLRSFRHPNIVRYIGTEVTPLALSIFLEYVPGGSLKALIDKFGQLEESVAKSYTRQVRSR